MAALAKSHPMAVYSSKQKQSDVGGKEKTMEFEDKKKRARKPNWTRDQCYLLASHVEDNAHILKD